MSVPVKILVDRGFNKPEYQTSGAAAVDLISAVSTFISKGESRLVKTPYKIVLPEGYEAQVRPRSGLALNHGVTVLNSPGTIDSDYRGTIGVILYSTQKDFEIKAGDRIAQLVIAKVEKAQFDQVDSEAFEALKTDRGEGGFGSTG